MSDRDQIVAALAIRALPITGTTATLRKRLLNHLMSAAPTAEVVAVEPNKPEPPPECTNKRKRRDLTAYNLFVRDNAASVLADGHRGKEMMLELARRWKASKASSNPPLLMITDESGSSSTSTEPLEKLIDALGDMSVDNLKHALTAHGKPTSGSKEALVERLALTLIG